MGFSIAVKTSNDIIAGNGSILSLHEYVFIIMFKKINYVHEFFILFSFDASYCIINQNLRYGNVETKT